MSPSARKEAMRERRAHWRRIFAEAAHSRLSIRQFCKERGVDETQFYYWRRQLAAEEGDGAQSGASDQAQQFVLVRPEERIEAADETATLELVLDRGWRLRIPRGADETTLRSVLSALTVQA